MAEEAKSRMKTRKRGNEQPQDTHIDEGATNYGNLLEDIDVSSIDPASIPIFDLGDDNNSNDTNDTTD